MDAAQRAIRVWVDGGRHLGWPWGVPMWPDEGFVRWLLGLPHHYRQAVFEFGYRGGRNLAAIAKAGYVPHGVDTRYAQIFVETFWARQWWGVMPPDSQPYLRCWDGSTWADSYPDGWFPVIAAIGTLSHLPKDLRSATLLKLARTLAPGGRGYLTFLKSPVKGDSAGEENSLATPEGGFVHWYPTSPKLEAELDAAGFHLSFLEVESRRFLGRKPTSERWVAEVKKW